ncbi:MAG TPA: hypothetical protein PKI20_15445 [Verrucomicrobiota bacterium]|nr:hypothetical protein [Verrucomicrobiota bacterium]HQL79128.1 hypothetical protein [Verrucomicrobiota bacterium]
MKETSSQTQWQFQNERAGGLSVQHGGEGRRKKMLPPRLLVQNRPGHWQAALQFARKTPSKSVDMAYPMA